MKTACCFFVLFFFLANISGRCQEKCDNAKDDDNDGLIDLKDPDCQCRFAVAGNLLQNGNFESFTHCPIYIYDRDFSIMEPWRFGTYTNFGEAIYYHNFGCALDSGRVMTYLPPAFPLPSGKGFIAVQQSVYRNPDFKETDIAKTYISQCLQQPLQAGEGYTLSFYAGRFQSFDDPDFRYKTEAFSVAIFGHADCNAVPFGSEDVNSNGCPANYPGWMMLGNAVVHSKGAWTQSHINFTAPPGINVVAIGPDCSLVNPDTELPDSTTRLDFYVYYLDDVQLLQTKSFSFTYPQPLSGNPCAGDSILLAPEFPNAAYQWYKDSIAIAGATQNSHRVSRDAEASYNVRITTSDTCFITEPLYVGPNPLSGLRLPTDTSFCKGETLLLAPSLNNISYNWNGRSDDAVNIALPGAYQVAAVSRNGCTKSFSVTVKEDDCNAPLLMPNAFTPNGDGNNDVFRIPKNSAVHLGEFLVYNRWGQKVFSTKNKGVGWNGNSGAYKSPPGTYVYFIRGSVGSKLVEAKGTVTLIR